MTLLVMSQLCLTTVTLHHSAERQSILLGYILMIVDDAYPEDEVARRRDDACGVGCAVNFTRAAPKRRRATSKK
jgi:hypothetical protein